ncbi:uncharacterized protein LAJ45_02685 [Morchella importuna]|uniref:uncharacterized protein n=1 Tax=Morchella importuna TaxID=1174673 RepID=UPI001E8CE6C3|nr:uncharacterized protein LAJ45_02685 [Morchella importuna]KAH8153098.1 hypothetical protein LAJ45_02685 [Morchella importuna]
MKFLSSSLLLTSVAVVYGGSIPAFIPERTSSLDTPLGISFPALYDLRQPLASSTDTGTGSWWAATYLKSSNNTNYLLISHLMTAPGLIRASLLDLDTLSLYKQFYIPIVNVPAISVGGLLNVSIPTQYGFKAIGSDGLPAFHTWAKDPQFSYNITFQPTSPIIYNAGAGGFLLGLAPTYQYSVPSAFTTGTLQIGDGEELTIDEDNSFTWFDRQWGAGLPLTGNFTWFHAHLGGGVKLSIWAADSEIPYQRTRFATIRRADGALDVRAIEFEPDYSNGGYKSTRLNNVVYATAWTVKFGEEALRIESVRKDQEMVGSVGLVSTYTGYITVKGKFEGDAVDAFGSTEVIDFKNGAMVV